MRADWWSLGHCELLWGEADLATYKVIPYDALSALPPRDGLDWLPPRPAETEGLPLVVDG